MTKEDGEVELDPSLIVEEDNQEAPQETPTEEPKRQEPQEDIPEKYRGKSALDVIRMHQDAEKLLGRQGNELGEVRKTLDEILSSVTKPSDPAPKEEEPEVDFFADPKAATRSEIMAALRDDPELKALKSDAQLSKRERSAQALLREHPDAMTITQDQSFLEWVSKSNVRSRMFQQAHEQFDNEVASELFSLWKDKQQGNKQTTDNARNQRQESVNKASTGSKKSTDESRGKPILSRERLIELKRTNPDRYYAQMDMIKQAYAEGRVQ